MELEPMNEDPKPDSIEWWREKSRHEERQKMFWMDQALSSHQQANRKLNQDLLFGLLLVSLVAIIAAVLCVGVL